MHSPIFGLAIAAIVALLLALPVAAEAPAPPEVLDALPGERPSSMAYDSEWQTAAMVNAREIEPDSDVEMWSLALLGPAAMIFVVAALGLTITVRSLRNDVRRRRSLDHYWRHGAMSRAGRASRG